MTFVRRKAKFTWQDYKIIEVILPELKINPAVKNIQSHRNKWIRRVR